MKKITFYHDGCSLCAKVGEEIVNLVGLMNLEVVHVGLNPHLADEARHLGVKAFPALVTSPGNVLHFNVEEHEGNVYCLL